jgi:dienelactone hydrolase
MTGAAEDIRSVTVSDRGIRRSAVAYAAVGVLVVAAGCGGTTHKVTIRVTPPRSLIDQPVRVAFTGLPNRHTVNVRATWRSYGGLTWTSTQPVRASKDGSATLHDMRFLWNMRPAGSAFRAFMAVFGVRATGTTRVRLAVVDKGRVLGRTSFVRRATSPDVRVRMLSVAHDGVYALYFQPKLKEPRPAVIAIGGSEGGISTVDESALLAAHGYPAMALGYFRGPGLPHDLRRVPLEYFARAARWVARQPGVDRRHIVIDGGSRGGEGALLIASTFRSSFHGAIGLVPSTSINRSLPEGDAAWTLDRKPIRPYTDIALERINGPVLVAGAGDDQIWGSELAVHQVKDRLNNAHFHFRHAELDFPHAGHDVDFAVPYLPQPDPQRWGGTRAAGAAARVVLWREILRYLARLRS